MKYSKIELLSYLNANKICYTEHAHKPLFTVDESKDFRGGIDGAHTKNLFLKDKKKKYYLLSCLEDKKIDLKKLRLMLGINNLSFGSAENLEGILGLKPGSVSPFGLINDNNKITKFLLDRDILQFDSVNFHPLVNNYTLNLKINDFINFIKKINVKLDLVNLQIYNLEKHEQY